MDTLRKLFDDQLDFQVSMIQDGLYPAQTYEERTRRTKEMILHLFSECDELLRASGAWKFHRNVPVPENREATKIEWVDAFKYLMVIAHIHGFSPEELVDTYWTKSMVVRQRYSEEWVKSTNEPSILVDIDNVLADYIASFLTWMAGHDDWSIASMGKMLIRSRPAYLDAGTLRITQTQYEDLKHQFRVSHQHKYMPLMPGAQEFLRHVQRQGIQIILLTARPITRYPNLYGDTLHWLNLRGLPYDFVWWAENKGDEVVTRLRSNAHNILYAVDDERRYIDQYRERGILAFWFQPNDDEVEEEIGHVNRLTRIPELAETYGGTEYVSRLRTSPARTAHERITTE